MRILALCGAVWAVATLPVLAGAPVKAVIMVWATEAAVVLGIAGVSVQRIFLAALVASVCVSSVDYFGTPHPGFVGGAPGALAVLPSDLTLFACLAASFHRGTLRRPRGTLAPLLALGCGASFVSLVGVGSSPDMLVSSLQWWVLVRGMVAAVVVASTPGERSALVTVLLVSALLQGIIAGLQQVHRGPLGLALLGEAPAEDLFKYIAPGVGLWRSGGTLGHPNVLATYLAALLPLALAVTLSGGPRPSRALAAATTVASSAGLVWTYSRAAWAAATVGALAVAWASLRRVRLTRWHAAAGLVALVLGLLAFPLVRHRIEKTESSATDVRVSLLSVATAIVRAYPLSGVGLGQFPTRVPEFDPGMRLSQFRHPVHHIVLLDAAEIGLLGGLASLLLWTGALIVAVRGWWRAGRHDPIGAALWVGSAVVVLHNMADWTLRRPSIALLFWLLAALANSSPQTPPAAERERAP